MADVDVKACDECGASIYPEHIGAHKAGYWGGKMFCVHCYAKRQSAQVTIEAGTFGGAAPPAARPAPTTAAQRPAPATASQRPAPALADADEDSAANQYPGYSEPGAGEKTFELGAAEVIPLTHLARSAAVVVPAAGKAADAGQQLKRRLHHDGKGATRCRVFHAKLNDGALQFMQDQINDWLDTNHDIEVKQVSTQVGTFEGKHTELHLIITVFY